MTDLENLGTCRLAISNHEVCDDLPYIAEGQTLCVKEQDVEGVWHLLQQCPSAASSSHMLLREAAPCSESGLDEAPGALFHSLLLLSLGRQAVVLSSTLVPYL